MAGGASSSAVKASLDRYEESLQAKSASLPALDAWYRTELRQAVKARAGPSNGAGRTSKSAKAARSEENDDTGYLTRAELSKLMKWKLTRGKFRPRLEQLILSNSEEDVKRITAGAFAILQKGKGKAKSDEEGLNPDWPALQDARSALDKLNALKGVGPATSSAILALVAPHSLAFMSDEGLLHAAGLRDKPKYSATEWMWYVKAMRARLESDKGKGGFASVEDLEKAVWAHAVQGKTGTGPKAAKREASSDAKDAKSSGTSKRRRK